MRERVRTAQVSSVEGAKRLAQWFLPQLRLANELLREDSRQRGRANRVNEPPARVVEYCNRRRRDKLHAGLAPHGLTAESEQGKREK